MTKTRSLNQLVNIRQAITIDLYYLHYNDGTIKVYDSLQEALDNSYNFITSSSYSLPVTVIYKTLARDTYSHQYIEKTVIAYDLMDNDIQAMIKICNNALARYYTMYDDDWKAWFDISKQCQKRATAVIMQKLRKQVKA